MFSIGPQAQIDGNYVQAKFTIPARTTPPKALAATRRDVDADKDGPKRQRERKLILVIYDSKIEWTSLLQLGLLLMNYVQHFHLPEGDHPCPEGDHLEERWIHPQGDVILPYAVA